MFVIVCSLAIISLMSNVAFADDILPPKKQMANGIPINEITCREGLELAFKNSDKSPACVKMRTGEDLAERGWITTEFLNVQFFTEKEEYSIGEPITITMKNQGPEKLWSNTPIGFHIMDNQNQFVRSWGGSWQSVSEFIPEQEITYTWDQRHTIAGKQVEPGEYVIKDFLFHFGIPYNSSKMITIVNNTTVN